eukprot:SAG31_NODE_37621_length_302_cov_2.285714_1_plen_55_part_10
MDTFTSTSFSHFYRGVAQMGAYIGEILQVSCNVRIGTFFVVADQTVIRWCRRHAQ